MNALIELCYASPVFYLGLVFVVSLLVGSFLNVVVYRLPIIMEREFKADFEAYFAAQPVNTSASSSAVTPGSAASTTASDEIPTPAMAASNNSEPFNLIKPDSTCPGCGHRIRAWENIPVISYLMLKGRCAGCKTAISLRYPLVELATALLCTWVAWHFGVSVQAMVAIVICWFIIPLLLIDLDKMLLPDQLTLPLLWLGLLVSTQQVFVDSTTAIIGATAGYLSLWSVYWLFKLATGKEGMGYGDFKLLAALGAFVGWQGLPVIIILSSLVGAIVGIALMLIQRKDTNLAIPFGPYLAVAGLLTLLYKQPIIDAYLNWVLL
ncbi:prepilin peptidase [Salinimonas sediminis]|uniref:Prepilin leader peptidase/N-methyltransferase n=1 Tax=Salinimonas sediminis TaxID=2303538 RepID=A0A346NPM1_9ALTE|nr:A24 family peptidase [Salinimonas sediminis]AXR07478.1 prepilin peptidase [Salinimonas sediminis]